MKLEGFTKNEWLYMDFYTKSILAHFGDHNGKRVIFLRQQLIYWTTCQVNTYPFRFLRNFGVDKTLDERM